MDQLTIETGRDESSIKPLHKCPKCDRTFGNIGHMKCHFYRVHPEFKLAEFELPEALSTQTAVKREKPEMTKQQQPEQQKQQQQQKHQQEQQQKHQQEQPPKQPKVKLEAPPVEAVPLTKIQQMLSKCETCNRCFTNKTSLIKHRVTVHGDRSTGFGCSTCNKSFPTAAKLRNHQELQHKVRAPSLEGKKRPSSRGRCSYKKKQYVCQVCQQGFLSRSALHKHELTHEEEDLQCEDCDARFELRSDLEEHAALHLAKELQEKDVEEQKNGMTCKVCNKKFGRRCNLVRHVATHKLSSS